MNFFRVLRFLASFVKIVAVALTIVIMTRLIRFV